MFSKLYNWLDDRERRFRHSFGKDISTPAERRKSNLHYYLMDHAILRTFWTNFDEVAPGVYRSNQPTHARLVKYRDMGIKSVLNLRGEESFAHYLFEKESCDELGLTLHTAKLWARRAPKRENVLRVIDLFRTIEKPFLMHCKSGADRAGFASAMYLMVIEGRPVEEAKKHLSLRYIHLKNTHTGVLDRILDVYQLRNAQAPIGFEDWIRTEYDHMAIQTAFRAGEPARI